MSAHPDLVIASGMLALPGGAVRGDIAVRNGRIVAIACAGELKGEVVIDAVDKLVLY
jgi:dihydroorotase-like cyclic amidohydrolase